ncbi:hypothetical protein [Patulibacter minatonensis]|uniref:hypothetical protein n=1 Tax=Patulibacter minatonensis TaxID=298163 RepID=UPI00047C18D3|nr:hypothetical protein [Patulibacter minatonensis]
MTADSVRFVGKHDPHYLPSGRPVAFGDELHVPDDLEQDEADRLIQAGAAVAIEPEPKTPARRTPTKTDKG